jgi:hypothetical protein
MSLFFVGKMSLLGIEVYTMALDTVLLPVTAPSAWKRKLGNNN